MHEKRLWDCSIRVVLLLGIGLVVGCGRSDRPPFYQVQGTITQNQKPLAGATLTFERIEGDQMEFARPSRCVADEEGRFEPYTFQKGDGLPAGTYRVGVLARKQTGGPEIYPGMGEIEMQKVKWKSMVPKELNIPATSGIEVVVTSNGIEPSVIDVPVE